MIFSENHQLIEISLGVKYDANSFLFVVGGDFLTSKGGEKTFGHFLPLF
jgi:hypothetical protein